MNIISLRPRIEARAALSGAGNSSGFISRRFRFVSSEEFGSLTFPMNQSDEIQWRDARGEISDVVMQVLNRLLYTGLVNVAERLVPAKRGDRC